MKRLSTWDTYVQEAMKGGDRSIELPLTDDESYIIHYPTRRQGRDIAEAQRNGDTDALLVAMLGEAAGTRVKELAEDWPAFVLDQFLMDVMKKFGMIDDDGDDGDGGDDVPPEPVKLGPVRSARTNGRTNGRTAAKPTAGKSRAPRKSSTTSKR